MNQTDVPRAPVGDLGTYQRETFEAQGQSLDIYRKGQGPAVLVLTELPGISPQVLGFADLVVGVGCTAVLPDMFGVAGRDPAQLSRAGRAAYYLSVVTKVCISREFTLLATGRSSPIVNRLRALAASEHQRCGGPGVGVVGMCFTGGFALAMAVDPIVIAPVLSQPSMPATFGDKRRFNIDSDPQSLRTVAQRCANEGLKVLGLRFKGDKLVSGQRFQFLEQQLGDGFIKVELNQSDGHPNGPHPHPHSVLTGDLIERPGEPTYEARQKVLDLFRSKLLAS